MSGAIPTPTCPRDGQRRGSVFAHFSSMPGSTGAGLDDATRRSSPRSAAATTATCTSATAPHTGALTPEFIDRFAVIGHPTCARRAARAGRPRHRTLRRHRPELRCQPRRGANREPSDDDRAATRGAISTWLHAVVHGADIQDDDDIRLSTVAQPGRPSAFMECRSGRARRRPRSPRRDHRRPYPRRSRGSRVRGARWRSDRTAPSTPTRR